MNQNRPLILALWSPVKTIRVSVGREVDLTLDGWVGEAVDRQIDRPIELTVLGAVQEEVGR